MRIFDCTAKLVPGDCRLSILIHVTVNIMYNKLENTSLRAAQDTRYPLTISQFALAASQPELRPPQPHPGRTAHHVSLSRYRPGVDIFQVRCQCVRVSVGATGSVSGIPTQPQTQIATYPPNRASLSHIQDETYWRYAPAEDAEEPGPSVVELLRGHWDTS